ncbi:MAG: AAA family ATPase [Ignavibacteriaceae bacterium]
MNKKWDGIFGQQNVISLLTKILNSSKIPHAFLFQGIEGCGKDFTAIQFAKLLNYDPTNKRLSDQITNAIENFSEPFLKYIIPLPRGKNENDESGPVEKLSDEEVQIIQNELKKKAKNPYHKIKIPKANNIKISSIRDIRKFLSLSFADLNYRVILISDAHLMNEPAQNALLKNLEEPPEGVVFIITTQYPQLLRETIRSRCWSINFQPLSVNSIQKILNEYFDIEKELAENVSYFAGGSVTTALKLLDNNFESLRDKTIFILRYSFGRKYQSALDEFSEFLSENDGESIQLLIQMIIIWLNDIQRYRCSLNEFCFHYHLETIKKFDQKFPNLQLNKCVVQLDDLASMIQQNINLTLIVLNLVFELSKLTLDKK